MQRGVRLGGVTGVISVAIVALGAIHCGRSDLDLALESSVDAGPRPTPTSSPTTGPTPTEVPPPVDIFRLPDPCAGVAEPRSCCLGRERYGKRLGTDKSCGANGKDECCSFDRIPASTFNRLNSASSPATLPSFELGRYLVTTARFKTWMDEGGGLAANAPPVSPSPGSGAHPVLGAKTGWQANWNPGGASCGGQGCLAKDIGELKARVYTDPASTGAACTLNQYTFEPHYPVNCVSIYEATAFCAWDGGYLITEAMWELAVRGGDQQRAFAWGSATATSLETSVHCLNGSGTWNGDLFCKNPAIPVPKPVGYSTAGRGRWGTFDLQGNLLNITADDQGDLPPCPNDCVSRPAVDPNRVVARGIPFQYPNSLEPKATYGNIINTRPISIRKNFWSSAVGFRCAYPSGWVSK